METVQKRVTNAVVAIVASIPWMRYKRENPTRMKREREKKKKKEKIATNAILGKRYFIDCRHSAQQKGANKAAKESGKWKKLRRGNLFVGWNYCKRFI